MERDIHKKKNGFERIKGLIEALPDDESSICLKKYLEYHQDKVDRNKMSFGGAARSLEIAFEATDKIPNMHNMKTKSLEDYWSEFSKRNVLRKLPTGKIINLGKPLEEGTLKKHKSQLEKYYKFLKFLKFNKPLSLFNSKTISRPDCFDFLNIDKEKKRKDFPHNSQEKVGELINELIGSQHYYARLAGTMVAIANDVGGRFSEIANLEEKDIVPKDDFVLIKIRDSKTAQRTVICRLSLPVLKIWLASKPKGSLVFPSYKKGVFSYNCMRRYLKAAAEKVGFDLPEGKAFHYFRHLASTRMIEMPKLLREYWFGWTMAGMESVYSHPSWEQCKKYYFASIKDSPLLDKPLSFLEEQQTVKEKTLEDRVKAMERLLDMFEQGKKPEDFIRDKLLSEK